MRVACNKVWGAGVYTYVMNDARNTTSPATLDTLPNNLAELRTGTASDGRALFHLGGKGNRESALRDLRSRLPRGWRLSLHVNGIDAILTCDAEEAQS